jgi:hypothetical protein
MNFTDLVRLPGVEKDSFGGRRLSSINVGHDTDISVQVQVDFTLLGRRCNLLVDILSLKRREEGSRLKTK